MLPVPCIVRRIWTVFLIFQFQIFCISGDCGPPPVIDHTLPVKETSGVTGDTVIYECDRNSGYYELPDKSRTITCQDDNTWTLVSELCARACGEPERLDYAVPKDSDLKDIYLPGTKVSFDCRLGFSRVPRSNNSIVCLDNYTWSIPSEFCTRRSCGNPGETPNGEFDATNFLFGSRVTYRCIPGYRILSRRDYRDCQADGKWSNVVPTCEVQKCLPPEDLKDGSYRVKKDEYTYNESVTYKCNTLQLVGKASVICTDEGKWSSGAPQCKAVCTFPPELDFAEVEKEFIHQEFFDIGKIVQYKCRPGFVPVTGKSNKLTCLNNLKWSQHELFCTRISCGNPGEIKYGQMQSENFLFGSRVNYTCNPGYSIITKRDYRECQADGTWSDKPPVCKEPVCEHIWELQEEARKCTSTPDEWIKYLQVQYLYLQIENLKLDIEIKKRQLDSPIQSSSLLHK